VREPIFERLFDETLLLLDVVLNVMLLLAEGFFGAGFGLNYVTQGKFLI